jgi:hypothetical protein
MTKPWVVDIRQIRDLQTPDPSDVKLPKDTDLGHFEWSTIFGDGTQRLIGRLEVVSPTAGISSSFSCAACSCPPSTTAAWITPGSPGVGVGGSTGIVATARSSYPYGGSTNNFTIYPSNWNINTPGYFTVTPNGGTSNMYGVSPGSSYFYTPFLGVQYVFNGQYCFSPPPSQLNPGGTGVTQQPYAAGVIRDIEQGAAVCSVGYSGWSRKVTLQLYDQFLHPIQRSNIAMQDTITVTSPNDLQIEGTQVGGAPTNASGQWPDSYFVCSKVCESHNAATNASQSWIAGIDPLPHINSIHYECGSITIDSQ